MSATELCFTPATELAAAIRSRALSPVEILDAVLARIEALNPQLNAFLALDAERARAAAREAEAAVMRGDDLGLLHGLPVSIKDLEPSAGIRCTFGSKFSEDNIAEIDGAVTERVKAAGGIVTGKTNTSHYGYKDMCDNLLGPPCRNPWKLDRTSGASSGGAAASVAAGLGPLAHGWKRRTWSQPAIGVRAYAQSPHVPTPPGSMTTCIAWRGLSLSGAGWRMNSTANPRLGARHSRQCYATMVGYEGASLQARNQGSRPGKRQMV